MKKHIVVLVALITTFNVNAAGWYEIDTAIFNRVEVMPDNRITVQKKWQDTSLVAVNGLIGTSENWLTNAIDITPPAGLEKAYLSIVITAITAGKTLLVYTSGSANSGDIFTSRIQMQ